MTTTINPHALFTLFGVKLHTIETTKQTPAMLAATTGQLPMVQWMHQHKFPLIGVDVCGMTILHHAGTCTL